MFGFGTHSQLNRGETLLDMQRVAVRCDSGQVPYCKAEGQLFAAPVALAQEHGSME
jgi:hypothetical protein